MFFEAQPFWESRRLWIGVALLSALPFLFVSVVPFTDLPNHVGRYYVFLNIAQDSFLQRFYALRWSLIGNLGVDVPVRLIGPWLGADLAAHVVVAMIPPLTVAGIYALSRSLNGRVLPSALLATPLVLNWPLVAGFVNFSLSAALALLVLAFWIRVRALSFLTRTALFAPLAFMTWVAHTGGWGLLGLGVFAFECSRAWDDRVNWKTLILAPFQTAAFAAMSIPILLWRERSGNGAAFSYKADLLREKGVAIITLMREYIQPWDLFSLAVLGLLFLLLFWTGGRKLVRPGLAIAIAFLIVFIVCPQELFKSGFADRRVLTYAVMMAALAIGVDRLHLEVKHKRRIIGAVAAAALCLFVARVTVSTFVWAGASRAWERHLLVLQLVPPQSRIFGLVVEECSKGWSRLGRPEHLQQLALVRRNSMVNGMFQDPGLNQVQVLFASPSVFNPNMFAVVHDQRCPVHYIEETMQSAIEHFPRSMFDFVWIIGEEELHDYDAHGLTLIWQQGNDRLYRVNQSEG